MAVYWFIARIAPHNRDMKIGIFLLKQSIRENDRYIALCEQLQSASYELYEIASKADIRPQTDLVLSIGTSRNVSNNLIISTFIFDN